MLLSKSLVKEQRWQEVGIHAPAPIPTVGFATSRLLICCSPPECVSERSPLWIRKTSLWRSQSLKCRVKEADIHSRLYLTNKRLIFSASILEPDCRLFPKATLYS